MGPLQRVRAYDWSKEYLILLSIVGYVVLHFLGLRVNKSKVSGWIEAHREVLSNQFYQVGPKPNVDAKSAKPFDLVVTDAATAFNTYATGRVNIATFLAKFKLLGRQNFITLSMEYFTSIFLQGLHPRDQVDIIITPSDPSAIDPFVFAIVNKDNMNRSRDQNYFLSITRTIDSDKLPPNFTFMTESAEVTDTILDLAKDLFKSLEGAENVLEFFAITDQQTPAPMSLKDLEPNPKIVISLKFPSTKERGEVSARIIDAAINLVDTLVSKKPWRPEVAKKIKATRESEIKKVQRALDAIKADELAQKKAETLRDQKKALSKLSVDEQRKLDIKNKEKEQRKLRNRQTRRG